MSDALIAEAGRLLRNTPFQAQRNKAMLLFPAPGKLDPAKLKFLSVFASITSRYGNRGQSDYAAANEVLSKLACDLDRRWPGRVVLGPAGRILIKLCYPVEHRLGKWSAHDLKRQG